MRIASYISILFLLVTTKLVGQTSTANDTIRGNAIIQNANSQKVDASTDTVYHYLQGDVRLVYDSVYFYCDTAVLADHLLVATGDVAIVKGDTLKLFADSLRYVPDSSKAYFYGYSDGNVVLENNDNQLYTSYFTYDVDRDIAAYTNKGLLITPDSKVKSGRGFFHVQGKYANFYDNVTVEGEDYDILTDSLRFYSDTKMLEFLSPVKVNQGKREIYSESGKYETQINRGEFVGNAQVVEDGKISKADRIEYDGKAKLTALLGNAEYISKDYTGKADSIYYNQKEEKIKLIGDAIFVDADNEVKGDIIHYDRKTESTNVLGRSFLSNPPYLITADSLDYQKTTELALADGNVIWKDTSNASTVYADHVSYEKRRSVIKAYNDRGKPVLESIFNDSDTLRMSGDTLIGYEDTTKQKVYIIYADVKVLMDDVQAICDSLTYVEADSQFVLHENPFMWSDSSQFSADTIVIHRANDKIDRVDLRNRSVILTTSDFQYFDQIAGMDATAYFQEEKIRKLDIVGDANSVYYLRDKDRAYIGANVTECDQIIFGFEAGELNKTHFYSENKHVLNPMEGTDHKKIRVDGFNWNIEKRPLTLKDLTD